MDPFSIALALSLMLGGAYFKKRAVDAQSAEQSRLVREETARQGALDQQRMADLNADLNKFGRGAQDDQQSTISAKMRDYLTAPVDQAQPQADYQTRNPGAPQEIKDREQAALADAMTKGRDYASRLADLSSYSLLNFNTGVTMNRLGQRQANFTTAQKHSADILPLELQSVPFRVGRGDLLAGDVLTGAGTIAGLGGFGGFGGTAAAADGAVAGGTGITLDGGNVGLKIPPLDAPPAGTGLRIPSSGPAPLTFGGYQPPSYRLTF